MTDFEAKPAFPVSDEERSKIRELLPKEIRTPSKTLERLKEDFAKKRALEDLRWKVFKKLQAYFLTIRYVTDYYDLGCLTTIVVFMTKDERKTGSELKGPIPLMFPYTEEAKKIFGEPYDYRQLNDDRTAIVDLDDGQIDEETLEKFLKLGKKELEEISSGVDVRMQELQTPDKVKEYAKLCLLWEEETGLSKSPIITKGDRHDLESVELALRRLSLGYQHALGLVEGSSQLPEE